MSETTRDLPHGGDLAELAGHTTRPPAQWIDLSTGINPWPYPLHPPAPESWQRLPGAAERDLLLQAARDHYGAVGGQIVAAPGTQALIQVLPRLLPPGEVAVAGFTYQEHARCWALAGHRVTGCADAEAPPPETRVLVVTNPNNPDGRRLTPDALLALAAWMAARDGLLLVDEAFVDVAPEISLAASAGRPGLCLLRSFGKFFGLAGLRLGFALCDEDLGRRLQAALGPWAVSGPALEIGRQALADTAWAAATRDRLRDAAAELRSLLAAAGLNPLGGTDLFQLTASQRTPALFDALCRDGILVRRFPDRPDWLRFGLPADAAQRDRLRDALTTA